MREEIIQVTPFRFLDYLEIEEHQCVACIRPVFPTSGTVFFPRGIIFTKRNNMEDNGKIS